MFVESPAASRCNDYGIGIVNPATHVFNRIVRIVLRRFRKQAHTLLHFTRFVLRADRVNLSSCCYHPTEPLPLMLWH